MVCILILVFAFSNIHYSYLQRYHINEMMFLFYIPNEEIPKIPHPNSGMYDAIFNLLNKDCGKIDIMHTAYCILWTKYLTHSITSYDIM